jgi:molybdopterin molybdotransferase
MRTSVQNAIAWIDANMAAMAAEEVALAEAAGRVAAQPILAASAVPAFDRAATDGIAVRAGETLGASSYNPLSFRSASPDGLLPAQAAVRLDAGDRLPGGADAILPLDHVSLDAADGHCEIVEPATAGSLIERAGSHAALGAMLLAPGRRLGPPEIGLLAAAGVRHLPVIRRPKVRVLLAGCGQAQPDDASGIAGDVDGPLLRGLIERDGGIVPELRQIERDRESLRAALAAVDADIVLLAGGTGPGADDFAAEALAAAGELAIHGVALQPGGSAGMGRLGTGAPVFLLPGMPIDCLWAYELFAGRAIRCLAGRNPALPFRSRDMRLERKIVSNIGMTEIFPMRCAEGQAEPIVSFAEAGLMAAVRADGFVILPEGSEGLAAGAAVTVYLFDRP